MPAPGRLPVRAPLSSTLRVNNFIFHPPRVLPFAPSRSQSAHLTPNAGRRAARSRFTSSRFTFHAARTEPCGPVTGRLIGHGEHPNKTDLLRPEAPPDTGGNGGGAAG